MPEPVAGYVTVPVEALPAGVRTLSVGELVKRTVVSRDAAQRFLTGRQCQTKTVRKICDKLNLSFELLVLGYPDAEGVAEAEEVGGEWEVAETLTPVITAPNDLQYRVYRLRHQHTAGRLGRGKRYDIAHLNPEARAGWLPKLGRHPEVCGRVRHARIPVHLRYFPADPAGAVWWVVDEWVAGRTLAEVITTEDPSAKAPAYAWQMADGLSALHAAGVVRRDLSPATVWVGDAGLLLTEFELAKLGQGAPTVSKHWPHNPYRTPEVHDGDAEPPADIYSWARIVTMLLLKELPPAPELAAAFAKTNLPRAVRDLLVAASAPRPSLRPRSFDDVKRVVEPWAKGSAP